MSIKKMSYILFSIAFLMILLSVLSLPLMFDVYKKAQTFDALLKTTKNNLENVSSALNEYLIFPTPRARRQLLKAADQCRESHVFPELQKYGGEYPRIKLLIKKHHDFHMNMEMLFNGMNKAKSNTVFSKNGRLIIKEIGSQLFLLVSETSGYLAEISSLARKNFIMNSNLLVGSMFCCILVLSGFIGFMVFWMQKRLVSPLLRLRHFVESVARGNFDVETGIGRDDEIGSLAESFSMMQASIGEHIKEITAAREDLHITLNSIGDGVIATDMEGRVVRMNPIAEKLTGWRLSKAFGEPLSRIFDIVHAATRDKADNPVERVLASGRVVELANHTVLISRDKMEYHIADSAAPIKDARGEISGVVLVFRDVTEKVRLEEMMVQSEKMLSVGGLAAGMAHEINNPLAGMIQTAGVLSNRLTNEDLPANRRAAEAAGITMASIHVFMEAREVPRMLKTINEAGHRIADIITNMLSFARKSDALVSSHDPALLLDKILELAATDYDLKKHYDFKTIEIQKEYDPHLPQLVCEGAKIQQVMLNILRNGAQAMQEAREGNHDKPRFILRLLHEKDTNMVRMEIEDNGPGMDEATRKRVFEPFFTTKPVGVGTGLGLSVSYFIITENHNGTMHVKSVPGQGATFIIRLPLNRERSNV